MDVVTYAALKAEIDALGGHIEEDVAEATEAWLEENVDPDTGYVLDSTLTMSNAAAPAKAVGDALTAQSAKIAEFYKSGKELCFTGEVSGTKNKTVNNVNIPSGEITFSFSSVESSDTDATVCLVILWSTTLNAAVTNFLSNRGENISHTIELSDACDRLMFYASDSNVHSTGDTFSFNGIVITKNITDKTLTISGKAADAKETGERIATLGTRFDYITRPFLYKCFPHVGCVGDSLASGTAIYTQDGEYKYDADLYEFSWGQYMARDSGNTYYNFSRGGQTTAGWMTDNTRGYGLASDGNHACECYIIGIGQNDIPLISGGQLQIGTTADVKSNPDQNEATFCGNYGKIIGKLQALYPKAKFFTLTNPINTTLNQAIKDVSALFANCYCLDLSKNVNFYKTGFLGQCLRQGHYNAMGYKIIAQEFEDLISNYIYDNPSEFQQIEFINTDKEYTVIS